MSDQVLGSPGEACGAPSPCPGCAAGVVVCVSDAEVLCKAQDDAAPGDVFYCVCSLFLKKKIPQNCQTSWQEIPKMAVAHSTTPPTFLPGNLKPQACRRSVTYHDQFFSRYLQDRIAKSHPPRKKHQQPTRTLEAFHSPLGSFPPSSSLSLISPSSRAIIFAWMWPHPFSHWPFTRPTSSLEH